MISVRCKNCGSIFEVEESEVDFVGTPTIATCPNCNMQFLDIWPEPVSPNWDKKPQPGLADIEYGANGDAATINYRDEGKRVSIDIRTHTDHTVFIDLYVGMGGIDSEDDMYAQAVISKNAGVLLYQALGKILSKHNA